MTTSNALDLRLKKNNRVILVDIIVTKNKELRALRPTFESKTLIPLVEEEIREFFKTVNPNRLNKRILGNLGGRSLSRAKRLVNASFNNKLPESITKNHSSFYVYVFIYNSSNEVNENNNILSASNSSSRSSRNNDSHYEQRPNTSTCSRQRSPMS